MKNKLFIVGASILQLPAIKAAKEMGLTVAVADVNPKAVAIPYADVFYNVSTVDEEGICWAAKNFGADGIITVATDMPMRAIGYTCDRLGLCGIDYKTALLATDKGEMIRAFEKAGLPTPQYMLPENVKDAVNLAKNLKYPLICKPVDNSGSRGVSLVNTPEELPAAVEYGIENSASKRIILEEYLVGSEVSAEVVIWNGEPTVLAITDKTTTGAPHFVEIGHSQPSRLPADTVSEVEKLAINAVKTVGIKMGAAHVEIMVTKKGAYLIELGARMGGDCITTHLVPLSTGIDMIKATIDICLGQAPDLTAKWNRGAAIRYFEPSYGFITDIEGVDAALTIPQVKEIVFTAKVGDYVGSIHSSSDRIGFVIADSETAQHAASICEQALQSVTVKTK